MDYKKAVQQAKKELEKEAIEEVKKYIKDTLQGIEDIKSEIFESQRKLKILKADLFDLEHGKLDKIKERQEKDKVAKKVSKVDLNDLGEKAPTLKPYIYDSWENYKNIIESKISTEKQFVPGYTTTSANMGYIGSNSINTVTLGAAPYNIGDISGTYTVTSSGGEPKSFFIQDRN